MTNQPATLIPVFARLESTADGVLRAMFPTEAKTKRDVQVYKDEACTVPFCRFPWDSSHRPTRRNKRVVINCWTWALQWVPAVQGAAVAVAA